MRLQYGVLVAATTFVAFTNTAFATGTSDATTLTLPVASRVLTTDHDNSVTKRFLRSDTAADEGRAEERGISQITNAMKYKIQKASLQKYSDEIFQWLNLAGKEKEIFASSQMRLWISYMAQIEQKYPGKSAKFMFKTLSKHYDDIELARLIQSALVAPSVHKIATDLQKVQFAKWLKAGKKARSIRASLNDGKATNKWLVERDEELVKAYNAFIKNAKRLKLKNQGDLEDVFTLSNKNVAGVDVLTQISNQLCFSSTLGYACYCSYMTIGMACNAILSVETATGEASPVFIAILQRLQVGIAAIPPELNQVQSGELAVKLKKVLIEILVTEW
ncbi:unnamed protein product [Phytophthora lilii]|uniref:RxLR effector protein n=1 Tax=Phytophthora lilii TaxID=2077276 RepID=A0A9W6WSQ5_9STRA|nr:unnamed protein product [Phytophthora lilii]